MSRKFLFIGIVILSALIGALLIYNFVLKERLPGKDSEARQIDQALEKEEMFQPRLNKISQEEVVSPTLNSAGAKVKYYLKESGKVVEAGFDGKNKRIISSISLSGLIDVLWSPQKNRVITTYQNGDRYFYDYNTNQLTKLHPNVKNIDWAEDGGRIAYQFIDVLRNSLNISNPDGASRETLAFYEKNKILNLNWISNKLYFYPKSSAYTAASLDGLNVDTKTNKNILSGINGLSVNWSLDGKKFIFSKTDSRGKGLSLNLSDSNGENTKSLNLSTLAEKCAWSRDNVTIYCAAPEAIPDFFIMPDNYTDGVFVSNDYFIKLNTETGEKDWLINPNSIGDYDASGLFLSPDEDYLFFTNRPDEFLYSIQIAE